MSRRGVLCPRCNTGLVHASVGGERIRYCEKCHGMLVDMDLFLAIGEELRSRHESSEYAGRQPEWDGLNVHIKCPQCGAGMDTHPYGGPGNVIVDSCENCSLNWLDYGELQRIVRAPDERYVIQSTKTKNLTSENSKQTARTCHA